MSCEYRSTKSGNKYWTNVIFNNISNKSFPINKFLLTLNPGETGYITTNIQNGFLFTIDTVNNPFTVVKIDLASFTRLAKSQANMGEAFIGGGAITDNDFLYVAHTNDPPGLVKFDLDTLERVAGNSLPSGYYVYSQTIDIKNGYGYFGTATSPGHIIKVLLSDLSYSVISPGANYFYYGAATDGNYAYFGATTNPAQIVRIKFSDDSITKLQLPSGVISPESMVVDKNFLYVATLNDNPPNYFIKIRLSDFTITNVKETPQSIGVGWLDIDCKHNLYAGTCPFGSKVIFKVDSNFDLLGQADSIYALPIGGIINKDLYFLENPFTNGDNPQQIAKWLI